MVAAAAAAAAAIVVIVAGGGGGGGIVEGCWVGLVDRLARERRSSHSAQLIWLRSEGQQAATLRLPLCEPVVLEARSGMTLHSPATASRLSSLSPDGSDSPATLDSLKPKTATTPIPPNPTPPHPTPPHHPARTLS